jgi:hypothetical protein
MAQSPALGKIYENPRLIAYMKYKEKVSHSTGMGPTTNGSNS